VQLRQKGTEKTVMSRTGRKSRKWQKDGLRRGLMWVRNSQNEEKRWETVKKLWKRQPLMARFMPDWCGKTVYDRFVKKVKNVQESARKWRLGLNAPCYSSDIIDFSSRFCSFPSRSWQSVDQRWGSWPPNPPFLS